MKQADKTKYDRLLIKVEKLVKNRKEHVVVESSVKNSIRILQEGLDKLKEKSLQKELF